MKLSLSSTRLVAAFLTVGGAALAHPAPQENAPATVHLAQRDGRTHLVGALEAGPGVRLLIVSRTHDGTTLEIGRAMTEFDGTFRHPLGRWEGSGVRSVGIVFAGARGVTTTASVPLPDQDPAQRGELPPSRGDVIVTEFMKDPAAVSDVRGEWVEVLNRTSATIDLAGWTLRDDGSNNTVLTHPSGSIPVAPGAFAVLAREGDPTQNGGVDVDAVYSGFSLNNGADQIVLEAPGGFIVDRVAYGDGPTWPDESGRSVSLSARAWGRSIATLAVCWCPGETPMPAGDLGTPGAMNDVCGD
ncbi:MAG: lamin tail domain-containing protein [Planctomycetota bacterium]